jgi:hypothetical protein
VRVPPFRIGQIAINTPRAECRFIGLGDGFAASRALVPLAAGPERGAICSTIISFTPAAVVKGPGIGVGGAVIRSSTWTSLFSPIATGVSGLRCVTDK